MTEKKKEVKSKKLDSKRNHEENKSKKGKKPKILPDGEEENKSTFERRFSRRQEMEDFSSSIQKSSIDSLKQMLHDLNI